MTPPDAGRLSPADEPLDDVDIALLASIREMLQATDPMPADLPERIRFSLALRDLEVEVAWLAAEEGEPVVAARGPEQSRTITFDSVLEGSGIYPLNALRASVTLLGLGVLVGLPLVATGGIALVMLGGLGLATAVLYSSTNFALKRLPAGELMILLTLGPGLSVATALSQGHMPSLQVLEVGLALGLFALALVLAAHLRDQEADRSMARWTLVQVNGQRGSIVLYTICLIAAYLLIGLVALPNEASHGALLVALSLPAALLAWSGVTRALAHSARQLAVRHMLRAYIYFSLWILVGLVVGGVIVQVVALIQGHL